MGVVGTVPLVTDEPEQITRLHVLPYPERRQPAPLVGNEILIPGRGLHVGCPAVHAVAVGRVVRGVMLLPASANARSNASIPRTTSLATRELRFVQLHRHHQIRRRQIARPSGTNVDGSSDPSVPILPRATTAGTELGLEGFPE